MCLPLHTGQSKLKTEPDSKWLSVSRAVASPVHAASLVLGHLIITGSKASSLGGAGRGRGQARRLFDVTGRVRSPAAINPRVEAGINPRFNPRADDEWCSPAHHGRMTATDYLINAAFLLLVFRQARERTLDRRSLLIPLVLIASVAQMYVHSIPTAGNDLALIGALAIVGLTFGVISGFATHVRAGEHGFAVARVGWLAGSLLVAGISSRMVFAFAVSHGARHAVAGFSVAHQIGAAAWPVALVSMAILEVSARVVIIHLRGRQVMRTTPTAIAAAA